MSDLTKRLREQWESGGDIYAACDRIEQLEAGVKAIMAATVEGRVCDDVAWFDGITTLHDYCDALLAGNEHLLADAGNSSVTKTETKP